uniref:Uncharacterized protein n=1 Tax=Cacopsylla melanoneura TaxID=428564 RepID=A0A8D8TE59_9HEMI
MIFMAIVRLPLHGQAGTISFTASRTAILCARFVDMEGGATYTNWRVPAASNADSSSCSCLLKTAAPSTYSFRRISPFLNAWKKREQQITYCRIHNEDEIKTLKGCCRNSVLHRFVREKKGAKRFSPFFVLKCEKLLVDSYDRGYSPRS